MKQIFCLVAVSLFVFTSLLLAAEFWETKDFSTWNEEDILKITEDSPWAKKTRIREDKSRGGGFGSFGGGGFGGGGFGGGGAVPPPSAVSVPAPATGGGDSGAASVPAPATGGSNSGAASVPAPPAGGGFGGGGFGGGGFGGGFGGGGMGKKDLLGGLPIVVLRWQSSLPIKQAIARFRYKDEVKTSKEAANALNRQESTHILGVIGLSGRLQSFNAESIQADSQLTIKDRPPIKPTQVIPQQEGDKVSLYIAFPRYNPDGTPLITLKDKSLEVLITVGMYDIVKKFDLKDMVYQGKLEF